MNEILLYLCQPLGFAIQMTVPAWMTLHLFRGQYKCSFDMAKGILLSVLVMLTLLFSAVTFMFYFAGSNKLYLVANLVFTLCLMVCFVLFFLLTIANFKKKIFVFLLMLNYACVVLSLSNGILHVLVDYTTSLKQLPYYPSDILSIAAVSLFLFPPFYQLVCKRYIGKILGMQEKGWNVFLGVQICYFSVSCFVTVFTDVLIDDTMSAVLLTVLFFSEIVLYGINFRLLEVVEENHKKELEYEEMRHNLRYQEQWYENMQETIERTRKQRHDLEHHFATLSVLSQNEENLPKIRTYLKEYLKDSQAHQVQFCENRAVNALLNYYAQQAKVLQVELQIQVRLPEILGIKDIHLSILFGNALKNALEAESVRKERGGAGDFDRHAGRCGSARHGAAGGEQF